MNGKTQHQFRRDLITVIRRHMEWPFVDVDRDSAEARDSAAAVADAFLPELVRAMAWDNDMKNRRRDLMALDTKAPKGYQKAWNGGVKPVIGLDLIAEEQATQVMKYSREHDDGHTSGELAAAAAALAIDDADCVPEIDGLDFVEQMMRTDDVDWISPLVEEHRDDRIRQLAIAGALIASEIDRLLRARKAGKRL